ncbi:hypothetical protein N7456_009604 [Penicillium angulare]|uniref:Uncharacterized protein n=1 Tax=Penicillium angulare TaxID=116970 RepID=A0A9W9F4Z5_9EURO|nr:hypothetical protein N7456_009604 [Penicillium angulare]
MSLSTFPPDDAGPRQVRRYIVDHLMSKHDSSLEFAQKTADLWRLGRGWDFRKATLDKFDDAVKTYSTIFGNAAAPFVLRSVREDCWNDWRASTLGIISLRTAIACFTISVLLFFWTCTSGRFAKTRIIYMFRNACWPIGPPILICAYLEHGRSPSYPVLLWLIGFYGTFAAFFSTVIIIANDDYLNPRSDEKAQEISKEKPS